MPAAFMSAVSCTYILMADEGFRISSSVAYPIGICFAMACLILYIVKCTTLKQKRKGIEECEKY